MTASLSQRRAREIASLVHRKYRERLGEMLVEGVRSVEAAVDAGAGLVDVLVTAEAATDARVRALLHRVGAPVHTVSVKDLARVSDVRTTQGVLAVARTAWRGEADLASCRTILALDGVQDPGNVGTLIRSAAWFGLDAVLAGPGTADAYQPKVVRAAMGGLWDVHMARTDDLAATLHRFRTAGTPCFGADLDGDPVGAWSPPDRGILVLGSEAHGLSEPVRAVLDARVAIPGAGRRAGAESLNVSVAGGILLYAWLSGRG